jgi:hypothetical protein
MSVTSRKIDHAVLKLAEVDYLDLWAIARLLVAEFGEELEDDPTALAVEAAERLLAAGSLRAGDLVSPGEFEAWQADTATAIRAIRKRLADLHRPLNVGDVGWFELVA